MKKYQPLHDFLVREGRDRFVLSFTEIEMIIGAQLPPSARHRDYPWWINDPQQHTQAQAWLDAGYMADVNWVTKHVVFRRVEQA
jgi:hypothetical protein